MRRRQTDPFEPQQQYNGLSHVEFNQLATYNAERARGIQHAAEWQQQMAGLQSRFNAAEHARFRSWSRSDGEPRSGDPGGGEGEQDERDRQARQHEGGRS